LAQGIFFDRDTVNDGEYGGHMKLYLIAILFTMLLASLLWSGYSSIQRQFTDYEITKVIELLDQIEENTR